MIPKCNNKSRKLWNLSRFASIVKCPPKCSIISALYYNKKATSEMWWIIAAAVIAIVAVMIIIMIFSRFSGKGYNIFDTQLDQLGDDDNDKVTDAYDRCPGTLETATVDGDGCSEAQRV